MLGLRLAQSVLTEFRFLQAKICASSLLSRSAFAPLSYPEEATRSVLTFLHNDTVERGYKERESVKTHLPKSQLI
jgi:hypothetical protein